MTGALAAGGSQRARPLRVGVVAGEHSGDRLGAGLLQALAGRGVALEAAGVAGPRLRAAGCRALADSDELAVVGLVEVLGRYRRLRRLRDRLIEAFLSAPPDVFVGVDAPEFTLSVERALRAHGIPVVHYVSPQVWAWREHRLRTIRQAVDHMLVLFPFEEEYYRRHDIAATWVGHPLADEIPLEVSARPAREALRLPPADPVLALLPGSRRGEVHRHLAAFMATAWRCQQALPALSVVLALADDSMLAFAREVAGRHRWRRPPLLTAGVARQALLAADAVLVASGTATLEAMLCKRPMAVAYRLAAPSYWLLRRMVTVEHVAMPNLLAGEAVVPEFVQRAMQPVSMAQALLPWLREPGSAAALRARFTELHRRLRRDASARAADVVAAVAGR